MQNTQPGDIFSDLLMALLSAGALIFCLLFLLIAAACFALWLYSNFFSERIEATIIGIRAYKKDTKLEDGKQVKTAPYSMYSPLLSCKLASGNVVSGQLSASQNWIPEKWFPGSKIKVTQGSDANNFSETISNGLPILALVIFSGVCAVVYNININKYVIFMLGLFLLYFSFKNRRAVGKIYNFIINARWKEFKQRLPQDRKAFLKRKKQEELGKNWQKLSSQEIYIILQKQYRNFFRGLPFLLMISCGLLAVAYFQFTDELLTPYMSGVPISDIAHNYPSESAVFSLLAIFGIFLLLHTTAKALRLASKKNSLQPRVF